MNNTIGWIAGLCLITGSSLLTACNTLEGAGKDVEKTGEVIQNCADRTDPSCKR